MDHLSSAILMCAILLLFYASRTVKGVAFDIDCTSDACTEAKTECNSTTSKCVCTGTTFRDTSISTCVDKFGVGVTCYATEQCSDTNTICSGDEVTGHKCLCKSGYFDASGTCTPKVVVNGTCISTDSSTEQCSKDNSECSSDGASGHRCFCTSAYYDASGTCTPRKKPAGDCALYQCVANAMCSTPGNKCACNTGYRTTSTSCEIVAFGDSCTIDIGCGEDNNVCSNSTCVCSDTSSRNTAADACSDAATIMLAHMHIFIFGTVASLYFLV